MTAPTPTRAEEAREARRLTTVDPLMALYLDMKAEAEAAEARAARAEAEVARLTERVAALEGALKAFAAIKPSSFYAADGTEAEGYRTFLHEGLDKEFTGADLAAARAALHGGDQ